MWTAFVRGKGWFSRLSAQIRKLSVYLIELGLQFRYFHGSIGNFFTRFLVFIQRGIGCPNQKDQADVPWNEPTPLAGCNADYKKGQGDCVTSQQPGVGQLFVELNPVIFQLRYFTQDGFAAFFIIRFFVLKQKGMAALIIFVYGL